jgi:hypothetical protein
VATRNGDPQTTLAMTLIAIIAAIPQDVAQITLEIITAARD